jgi:flagellar hook-length control protein FliK
MNPAKGEPAAMTTPPKAVKEIMDLKPVTEIKEKNKIINSFVDQNKSDKAMELPTLQPLNEKVTDKTEMAAMPLTPQDIKTTQALQDFGAWVQTKVNTNIVQPSLTASSLKAETMATTLNTAKMNYPAQVEVNRDLSAMDINMANYRVNIKIYPPELGKITASLKMDKKSTSLEVVAETKEVKAMLQNHLSLLKEQFNQSNIQLDKVEVRLAGDQQRDTKQESEAPYQEFEEPMAEETNQKPSASIKKRSTAENAVDAYV